MNKLPLHTKVQIKLKTGFFGLEKKKEEKVWRKCFRDNNSSSTFKMGLLTFCLFKNGTRCDRIDYQYKFNSSKRH